ncbi:hypothetical protein BDP27DRAFT_1418543 [Rhodocollybia butyracea]|uniref:Nephrocystin 3-like N-terminal domain-containing protein n=1 Tax=Rhodocollybia butyracea TaxID=206335 RepID=A0A9P5PYY1_9AGAR|nr:hypothetical protein BDP27DRAFT_1418543 [Rhodocollybia butyracea]
MFSGSHDFVIGSGTFNYAGRDVNISTQDGERGLHLLHGHTSTSAVFNAEARFPPPLCHPGTREYILRELKNWVKQETPQVFPNDSSIRWLYGPAGAGKSAIAQTVAEACAKNGTLAGSFFFWRSDPSRNNPQRLFTTLALQIAGAIPGLRAIINSVVIKNPPVLTSSIEVQFNDLILQPWFKVQMHQELLGKPPSSHLCNDRKSQYPFLSSPGVDTSRSPPSLTRIQIVIIDGLDECSNSLDQRRILSILGDAMHKHPLPFRILIASRPEPRIKESFNKSGLKTICRWIPLDDDIYRASREIRAFLQDRFREILCNHSHTMEHVARPWPTDNQIEVLVQKSSGHFIYPSTVLKYIDDDGAVPADRLDVVLGIQPLEGAESPFVELDALYHQILSTARKKSPKLVHILGAIIVFQDLMSINEGISRKVLVHLLTVEMKSLGALRAALSGLHSLFSGPSPVESDLRYCHASFAEFLSNHNRSLEFYINKSNGHDYLAQCCLSVFEAESTKHFPQSLALKPGTKYFPQSLALKTGSQTLVSEYVHRYWALHHTHACGTAQLLSRLETFNIYSTPTFDFFTSNKFLANYSSKFPWSLGNFLADAYTIQAHFKSKHNTVLKHFLDISTVGFNIVMPGRITPIRLSTDSYSQATPSVDDIMASISSQLSSRSIVLLPGYPGSSSSATFTPLLTSEDLLHC